jgi:hypothetical protein
MSKELLLEDFLASLEDLRESEASKDDVIDAVIEFVHANLIVQESEDEEEYSFIDDEEIFEEDEDDQV